MILTSGQFIFLIFMIFASFIFGFAFAINLKCVKIVTKRGEKHGNN